MKSIIFNILNCSSYYLFHFYVVPYFVVYTSKGDIFLEQINNEIFFSEPHFGENLN